MTEIQSHLLEMLKWYHEFCVAHGLRYYALGGTVLGAMRHKGFIPWDDDVDVGMPRPDYERFFELAEKEINGKTPFFAENISNSREFICPYGKLYDTRTTLIENGRYKLKRGLFLDVFPLDGLGDTRDEAYRLFNEVEILNNLWNAWYCEIRKGRKWYKNAAIQLFKLIPNNLVAPEKVFQRINGLCKRKAFDDSIYVANMCGSYYKREITQREKYGTPQLREFESISIYLPEMDEDYLSELYGEWRRLPPKEQRVSNHSFIYLDLKKSYLE